MKALLMFAAILLFGCASGEAGEEIPPDKISAEVAKECKLGGGCYAVPKAAIEKMRSLFSDMQRQLQMKDEEIEDLRKKLPRSCA